MRQKLFVAQRTRHLNESGTRCRNTHPNWAGIRCEFSVSEYHDTHIGENGKYVWHEESRNPYKKYLNQKGEEYYAQIGS